VRRSGASKRPGTRRRICTPTGHQPDDAPGSRQNRAHPSIPAANRQARAIICFAAFECVAVVDQKLGVDPSGSYAQAHKAAILPPQRIAVFVAPTDQPQCWRTQDASGTVVEFDRRDRPHGSAADGLLIAARRLGGRNRCETARRRSHTPRRNGKLPDHGAHFAAGNIP